MRININIIETSATASQRPPSIPPAIEWRGQTEVIIFASWRQNDIQPRKDARAKDELSARTPKHSLSPTKSRLEQQEREHTHISCGGKNNKMFRSLGVIATGLVDPWDLPTPALADAQVRSRAREMCKKTLKRGCVPTDDVLAFLLPGIFSNSSFP